MNIFTAIDPFRAYRQSIPLHQSIGFVPTMGNLHEGHMSLIQQSRQNNNITIASIFVNPTQFNQQSDFENYPKTLNEDCEQLIEAGCDALLLPDKDSMYPNHYQYRITENKISLTMEGVHRPGHFDGMLTIVMKLFQLVQPRTAYFGEKDKQQVELVKGLCTDFFLPIQIIECETIREPSKLAKSSRNGRLSKEGLNKAHQFASIFHQYHREINDIHLELINKGYTVDYLMEDNHHRYIAIWVEGIRLIDNYAIAE